MDAKQVFYSILENEPKYKDLQFNEINNSEQDELLLLIMKQVFFYSENKFKCKKIKEKMKKHKWVYEFIGGIITTFVTSSEVSIIYGLVIQYFYLDYDNIKNHFIHFIKEIEKIKSNNINFDLFQVAVCFMCYLNGNNKFSEIISYLKENKTIKLLEIFNENELTKQTLHQVITEYCAIYKYPIILDKLYDKEGISKEGIIRQMKLFKCYAELCPMTKKYKNFILSLCSCLKNCEDLRNKKEKNVSEFIEEIFIILHLHLKIPDYWEDNNILLITNQIYSAAFQYSTENFDQNYIDFVISYMTYYNISAEDFLNIFLKGLNEDEFTQTFQNLQLNETIGSINDKKTITGLINKIYKKKKNLPKSLNNIGNGKIIDNNVYPMSKRDGTSIGPNKELRNEIIIQNESTEEKNENDIKETNINKIEDKKTDTDEITNQEENDDIKCEMNIKRDEEISIDKINFQANENNLNENEPKDNKESPNVSNYQNINTEDISNIKKEMKLMKEEFEKRINNIEKENKLMKEENKLMKENIDTLENKNRKQEIEIKELTERIKSINLNLEMISFRDLSKKVLNNMIDFVNKNNDKLLKGLSKRKEKLNKINKSFDFKDIEFMRKPFKEICDKYYYLNSRSHVPDIAKSLKKKPFGLIGNPAETILKKYYEVMIDSKQEEVPKFLYNTLNLKAEINSLYL